MNATLEPPRTAAAGSQTEAALIRAVAAMGRGWTVLSDCQIGEDRGKARARVRYALLHPDAGIALVDILPGATTAGAPTFLRRSLEAAGFRAVFGACPPIVYLSVPPRALFRLDDLLTEQFDLLPPLALSGGDAWVIAAQGMLSVHPPLRYPWQGTVDGHPPPRQGWRAWLRFVPLSIAGPRCLAAFWSAVALVFGGGALFLQYLGPPEAPAAVAHAKPGAARAQTPEAPPASASMDQPRRPPSPGPVLAVWPSGPMPARLDAARASFAFREAEGAAGVAEPGAKAVTTLAGLDATGSDAEAANGASGPTHVGDGPSSMADAETESGSARADSAAGTAPAVEEASQTGGGPAQADRAAAADSASPTTSKFGATEPTPEPEGNSPNPPAAHSADPAPAGVKAPPATAGAPVPAASAEASAPDDRAGTDAASKPEAAVEMMAEPSADPNVAAPRTAAPSPDGATPPVATAEPASPGGSPLGEAPASTLPEPSPPPAVAAAPLEVPPSSDAGQPATAPPPAPRAEPPTGARSPTGIAVAPTPADRAAAPRPSGDEAISRPAPPPTPVARPVAAPENVPPERTAEPAQPAANAPAPGGGTQTPAPTQAAATERRGQATPLPPALVEALVTRGDAMMSRRDVSAARLLYERAAAAGEARAATALAKTYDPDFLAEIGAQGIRGDAAIAAAWYRKANSLGDSGALARAEALSGRGRPAEGRP